MDKYARLFRSSLLTRERVREEGRVDKGRARFARREGKEGG